MNIIEKCRLASIELLKKNSQNSFILASASSARAKHRNYLSVFARDVSIIALGVLKSNDKELLQSVKNSLALLARHQATNGQIPNFVKPKEKQVDFWYTDCIDATLWWLIAVGEIKKQDKKFFAQFKKEISKALAWLQTREHPAFYLLSQQEASDWTDLMPRRGFVLYSNALWYRVKTLYNLSASKQTKDYFNYLFGAQKIPAKILKNNPRFAKLIKLAKIKKNKKYLLSYVAFAERGKDIDVLGNLLAVLFNAVSKKQSKEILNFLLDKKVNKPYPARALLNPIKKEDKNWRDFMTLHNQNKEGAYHNGGIWPFIGAFWVLALRQNGFKKEAQEDLIKLANLNLKHNFNEWHNAKTMRACGKSGQSWNAGAFLLALNK